jgi:hypothetical protein
MGVAGTTSRTLACSGDSVARVDREGDTYLADLPAPLVLCTSPGRRLWLVPPAHLQRTGEHRAERATTAAEKVGGDWRAKRGPEDLRC